MRLFDGPGEKNTEAALEAAGRRGRELGIRKVVVATTRGRSALMASELLEGFSIIAVTHSTGFKKPDFQELEEEAGKELERRGVRVLTATHAFGGIGRAVRRRLGTYETEEIIANVFRRMGEGMKVAVEITLMAADAGLVGTREDVISVGGTAFGEDTAIVVRPAHTHDFFDVKIREIICKPFDF